MRKIFILIIINLIGSCTDQSVIVKNVDKNNSKIIEIDVKRIDEEKINKSSEFIETIEYIPLDTTENVIIGEISNLIVDKELFYLYDRLTKSIFMFDQDGRYVSSISASGKGDGEYIDINAFCIDPVNGNILIFDARRRALLAYDQSGKFVQRTIIDASVDGLAKTKHGIYLHTSFLWNKNIFDSFPLQSELIFINDSTSEMTGYLDYEYNEFLLKFPRVSNKICQIGNEIIYLDDVGGRIYSLGYNGHVQEKYKVDFGENNIPLEYRKINNKGEIERLKDLEEKEQLAIMTKFMESQEHIYINYTYGNFVWGSFHSKNSKNYFNSPVFFNDIDGIQLPLPITCTDSTYVGVIHAYSFKQSFESPGLHPKSKRVKQLNEKLRPNDNPVLVIMKLRKDF